MATVAEIESAIKELPKDELAELSAWFERYESELWDEQIASDSRSGRFADLKAKALAEHEAGETRPL
jgi:hypothetical protein